MSYPTFVNLLGVVIGFVAALFFCVGQALLTRKEIVNLNATLWGSNPHLAVFFQSTKAEYFCGGVALCLAFSLQFLANVPGALPDGLLFTSAVMGVLASMIISGLAGVLLLLLRRQTIAKLAAIIPPGSA